MNSPSEDQGCDCDDGYRYFPHSCGEPMRGPCLRCRPEEAARESTQLLWLATIGFAALLAVAFLNA